MAVGPELTRDTRVPLFGVHEYSGIDLMANGLTDLDETTPSAARIRQNRGIRRPRHQARHRVGEPHPMQHPLQCLPSRVYWQGGDYVTGSHATDYVDHVSLPWRHLRHPRAAAPA